MVVTDSFGDNNLPLRWDNHPQLLHASASMQKEDLGQGYQGGTYKLNRTNDDVWDVGTISFNEGRMNGLRTSCSATVGQCGECTAS